MKLTAVFVLLFPAMAQEVIHLRKAPAEAPQVAAAAPATSETVPSRSTASAKPVKSRNSTAIQGKQPPSDAVLLAEIQKRFARSKIAADNFRISVQRGVVVLTGRTDVVQHKGTATRVARNAGAVAVDNRIEVSEAARQKAARGLQRGRRREGETRTAPKSERGDS